MANDKHEHTYGIEYGYEESGYTGSLLSKASLSWLEGTVPKENSEGNLNYDTFEFCPRCGAKLETK